MGAVVWTDGSCNAQGVTGRGGWAVLIESDGQVEQFVGSAMGTTNNRMELTAVCEALERLSGAIEVRTDSTYIQKCFEEGWHVRWRRDDKWRTSNGPVKNRDIWERLFSLVEAESRQVSFVWVKGHATEANNNVVDRLAREASESHVVSQTLLDQLEHGPARTFAEWPQTDVPTDAAGVYTVWRADEFIYVGMSGRGLTVEDLKIPALKRRGLWTRLNSHASGQRSGDKFCIYISDRFVLPSLESDQIAEVSRGELSLDHLTRVFIREFLTYRYVVLPDGDSAYLLENEVRRGGLGAGPPFLNPLI